MLEALDFFTWEHTHWKWRGLDKADITDHFFLYLKVSNFKIYISLNILKIRTFFRVEYFLRKWCKMIDFLKLIIVMTRCWKEFYKWKNKMTDNSQQDKYVDFRHSLIVARLGGPPFPRRGDHWASWWSHEYSAPKGPLCAGRVKGGE